MLTLLVLDQELPDVGKQASLRERRLLSLGDIQLVLRVVDRTQLSTELLDASGYTFYLGGTVLNESFEPLLGCQLGAGSLCWHTYAVQLVEIADGIRLLLHMGRPLFSYLAQQSHSFRKLGRRGSIKCIGILVFAASRLLKLKQLI